MLICGWSKPWPHVLLILLITSSVVSNGPWALWITVPLLLPSQYLKALLTTPYLPTGLRRIACFSVLCFGFISSFTSSLDNFPDFHPKSYYFFWLHYVLLPLPPYFPPLLSNVSLALALGFPVGSLPAPTLPLLCFLPVSTWLLCWLMKLYSPGQSEIFPIVLFLLLKLNVDCGICVIYYMQMKEKILPTLLVRGGYLLYCNDSGSTVEGRNSR